MQIFVKIVTGKTNIHFVDASDTIDNVKAPTRPADGAHIGNQLEDGRPLPDFKCMQIFVKIGT
eukprot:5342765-Karenia_brevis.AAC.1